MKILIASDSYKFQTSGAANVVITLANGLRRRGHSVKVLALSNTGHSYRDGDDYYIRSLPFPVYPDLRTSFVRRDPLLDELKAWKPDVIHLHTEGCIARMTRKIAAADHAPLVMTSHTDYAQFVFGRFCETLPVRLMAKEWGRFAYRGTRAVIAPSEKALSFSQLRTVARRSVVIPNGIRLSQFQKNFSAEERAALFAKWGLRDNGKTLVMVSRISKEKNIREILGFLPALLRREPDAQLVIAGDGPERAELEAYSRTLGLTDCVRFTGRIPPEEVYRYYDMGQVFVSASTFEVHSLTYLEALSCGLPLVCRADPCLKGVLEDGENGYAYHTERDFVESVSRILDDGTLRARLCAGAIERAQNFSDERFVDRTLALYEKVLRRSRDVDRGRTA